MKIFQSLPILKFSIALMLFICCHSKSTAQIDTLDSVKNDTLRIGVMIQHPYVELDNGEYYGLNIDLIQTLESDLGFHHIFQEFENMSDMVNALSRKEIDMIGNPISPNPKDANAIDFTYPFLVSNLAVATKSPRFPVLVKLAGLIFSMSFLSGIIIISLFILFFAYLTWRFERKTNEHHFPNNINGLWEAFWWSAVTMTTVGYGDKTPKTVGGRISAMAWMFTAIIIISGYTGTVVSLLSNDEYRFDNKTLDDFASSKVVLLKNHSSEKTLDASGIKYKTVETVKDGLSDIADKKADIFIHDKTALEKERKRNSFFSRISITPSENTFQLSGFAMYKGHPLFLSLNEALIKETLSLEWKKKLRGQQNSRW